MNISSVVVLGRGDRRAYVPPRSDYAAASDAWVEAEYHCFDGAATGVRVGYWTGEPGSVRLDPWPYTEIGSVLTGRVAIADLAGGRLEFGPGDGFVVPKGFVGDWFTLEPATKYFIAVS